MQFKNIEQVKESIINAINKHNDNEVELGIRELLEYLTIHMMKDKSNSDLTLIAVMLIKFDKIIDFEMDAPCEVNISKKRINLYINPLIFINYSPREMEALLQHEVYHILNNHIHRINNINISNDSNIAFQLNIAADAAINQYISNLPDDIITLKYFIEKILNESADHYTILKYKQKPFEYYYDLMKQKKSNNNDLSKDLEYLKKIINNINNAYNKNNKKEFNNNLNEFKKSNNPLKGSGSHQKWKDTNNLEDAEMTDLVKDFIENAINDAVKMNPSFDRGKLSKNIKDMIDSIKTPPIIKWQTKLKEAIASFSCPYKKTLLRRPRRSLDRYDLKGKMNDRSLKITIAVDTSGSISDKDLKYFFNEIFNIIQLTKFKLTVIQADYEIKNIKVYKNKKEFNTDSIEINGRGGTAFSPVFEYINSLNSENYPDVFIYFTDGMGEKMLSINRLKRPLYLLWVLTNNKHKFSLQNPLTNKVLYLNV